MAKATIGQFMAALRKANGMTQQDIADRLNVSNKSVSRWERDECSPDLSVIPALAEILGVTCDELLKGERIIEAVPAERKEQKVEKQVKSLINRTLSGFKTLIWIALAAAVFGLILMFGIAYGFYRPVIGFFVMLLFEVSGLVLTVLAVSRAKDTRDNEIFDSATDAQKSQFSRILGRLSFSAFFAAVSAVLLSLPFILVTTEYVSSVITAYSYFTSYFPVLVLVLAYVYIVSKKPYMAWITGGEWQPEGNAAASAERRRLNIVQLSLTGLAGILFVITPYFLQPDRIQLGQIIAAGLGLASIAASIVYFVIFTIKHKACRSGYVLSGVRNICLLPAAVILRYLHTVSWNHINGGQLSYERYETWHMEYLWYAFAYCLTVITVFSIIRALITALSRKL